MVIASGAVGGVGSSIIGLLMILIGAVTLLLAGRPLFHGLTSHAWPSAEGRLESFEIRPTSKFPTLWMRYTYWVHGRPFTGTRYRIAQIGQGASMVPGTPGNWHVGQPLTVRYNARSPEISTIETGIHPWASIGEIILVILAMGLLVGGWSQILPLVASLVA